MTRQYQDKWPRTLGGRKAIHEYQLYVVIKIFSGLIKHADTSVVMVNTIVIIQKIIIELFGFFLYILNFFVSHLFSHLWKLQPVLTNVKGWANGREEGDMPTVRPQGGESQKLSLLPKNWFWGASVCSEFYIT